MANRLKLNEKVLRDAEPQEGNSYQIFDREIRGLAAKVQPSGNRAFTLDYRFAGRQTVLAFLAAFWIAFRQGRQAAAARFAVRRADARVRSMQTSKDIRHDVQNTDRADLERRAHRWMRD